MPAVRRAPAAVKFAVAAIFLCGIGFGAFAALTQPEPSRAARPKPEPVAKIDPKAVEQAPEPKPEPKKPEPKKPDPKPEPKKPEPKKPEPKKPDPMPEPKKPDPKPEVKPDPPKPEPKKPEAKPTAVTAQQALKVLRDNCTSCHGAPVIKAGIDLRTLDSIKKKKGLVVPGDLSASDLWGAIDAGTMPPPDAKTKMTDAEKKLIKDWIAAGAK